MPEFTAIVFGVALTVDCPALGGPADTVMTGCWLSVTPPAAAVMVCEPAPVELNVPLVVPLPFVVPGWVMVLPVPVAARVTEIPLIAFPLPSLTVMVTVEPPPAANDVGDASTVDNDAETAGPVAFTVTDACWVMATPLMVAETSLTPVAEDVRVLVNTPLPLVVPDTGFKALPLPLAATVTEAPAIVALLP